MAYCIMRFEKLKAASMGSLAGSLAHTMRSRYTPNADPELIKDNKVLLGPESTVDVVRAVRDRWPEKHRKDAVGCIEYFIGASPEWFKKHGGEGDQEAYFQGAIEWLKREYGEENVISVVQHNDETSPHLAAYVVPIDAVTGRLNAKHWTGGRAACAQMQTRFQEFAGEPVGLERGVRGSKAEHMTIQRWYQENTTLEQRKQTVYGEEIGLEIREQALREDGYSLDHKFEELRVEREALRELEDSLSRREQEVQQKGAELAQREQSLGDLSGRLGERENALQSKSDALQQQSEAASERERRLASLESELAARGVHLAGGEEALQKRQAEIDAAGAKLQQRLAEARQHQEAFQNKLAAQEQDFNQRRTAWLESNRPQVPPLVQKLLAVQEMGRSEALDFIDENFEIEEYYNPVEGLSPEAKALLAKYQNVSVEKQRWDRTFEVRSKGNSPGI